MASFIVYAMPRSRSYWTSRWLTHNDWACSHDVAVQFRSMDDVKSWLRLPRTGSVETSVAPYWRLARHLTTIVLRRPIEEILDSVARLPIPCDRPALRASLQKMDGKLKQIEDRVPDVLSLSYADLYDYHSCTKLYERCLPYKCDSNRYALMADMNLQTDIRQQVNYFMANEPQISKMASIAKHAILRDMSRTRPLPDKDDGISFAVEPFDQWYHDAEHTIEDHVVVIGDSPDAHARRNLTMLRQLDSIGAMQIVTARQNGRVFGYLMSIISPSLEDSSKQTGLHAAFYADPGFPGLGMRLIKNSLQHLRARGVDEAYFSAGHKGSGNRINVLYRRLGAVKHGEIYRLDNP